MKKSIIIIGLMLSMILSAAYSQPKKKELEPPRQTTDQGPTKKEISPNAPSREDPKAPKAVTPKGTTFQGKFVSLADYMSGKMSGASYTDKDQPLVFVTGEGANAKIYFLYNADGTYAGSKMLSYTANKTVTVTGKAKVVNGLNLIYADNIQPAS